MEKVSDANRKEVRKKMKKNQSIQQELFTRFLVAALVPILFFELMTYIPAWRNHVPNQITIVVMIVIAVTLSFYLARPYLRDVTKYRKAQMRLESGDLNAKVEVGKNAPREIQQIAEGFNRIVKRMNLMVEHTKQVAEEQRKAELSALEAQINPHFLYNTLDAINWKAIENEQYEISELIGALADIFRHTVHNPGGLTTLGKALEWSNQYILLQSVKLGKKPELIINVPEELKTFQLYKLLLQPFVENAVKYAFEEKEDTCILQVEAKQIDDQVHIILEDNGKGMSPSLVKQLNNDTLEIENHVGIANVKKRLNLYYGDDVGVYFESVLGQFTRVHLFVPMLRSRTDKIIERVVDK